MGEGLRILLIEGQPRYQTLFQSELQDALTTSVHLARTTETALAALGEEPPWDLVLLDLAVSGTSGQNLLQQIRSDHRLRFVPVIVLTRAADQALQMDVLEQGANDFIEKNGPPSVLVARVKAQLRHKMALDSLERLAVDRDLFAAGVLHDIDAAKGTIVSLCQAAKALIRQDPTRQKETLLEHLGKLSAHASKLGAYAADIIQSVRDSQKAQSSESLDLAKLLDWALEVAQTRDAETKTLTRVSVTWESPRAPVLADKSFLRLALLNAAKHAIRQTPVGQETKLTVTQSLHENTKGTPARPFVLTRLRDHGKNLAPDELKRLFDSFSLENSAQSGLGLTLVAKVMARMGGRAWADPPSDGGPGTVLCFDLPAG